MDDTYQALIGDFIEEALPLAERLSDAFLEIEKAWACGKPADRHLPGVKSDLHTLKGNSGLMGLVPIQSLTHAMEDVCDLVANDPDLGTAELADLLLEGCDSLHEMIRASTRRMPDPDMGAQLLHTLEQWTRGAGEDRGKGTPTEAAGDRRFAGSGDRTGRWGGTGETVRIDFRKLDGLLEMVGEAMVSRSMLHEAQRHVLPTVSDSATAAQLDRSMQSLDMALKRLQEGLVETRLLPVSRVFRRFARQVRDLARESNRVVNLVTAGTDTTIDKAIIDKLGEPLLHLVRNAVAHGIEDPEERKAAGKPPEATIELQAVQLSDRVVISVRDDGRGLDEKRIAARARELGFDTGRMNAGEMYSLIFRPGFSTAEGVSTLSGRGVGLDVVATNIEALGGSISVDSDPGRGATFRMDLPLTLAVVKALFVDIHGERYALPLSYVEESFRVDPSAVHAVDGKPTLSWRGRMIPLVDGGEWLGTGGGKSQDFCVVISTGAERCGLRVGRLLGHRDVVVKGLENTLGQHELLSGVTVMGDGRVVFILDAARITGGSFGSAIPVKLRQAALEGGLPA